MANGTDDFEALARRYWESWGDAMRASASGTGVDPGLQGFREALDAWTGQVAGAGGFDGVLAHFNNQGKAWYAQMQQVAAGFAGRDHSARDVAEAWRQALGAEANPFLGLLQGMRGPGLQGLEQWSEAAAPWLRGMRGEALSMLGMPAFGLAREHQERLQALARSQLRWQDALSAWNALMAKASQDAFGRFESKLAEREEPGRQVGSVRALFDLWVDAAEDAYAEVALSHEYRRVYGELVNAQMQLRADAQAIAGQAANLLGLPGRTELDSAHRKIAELERQLRRMQRGDNSAAAEASRAAPARKPAAKKPARKPAKAAAKKAAKRAPAKAPARAAKPAKRPVKKPASTKSAGRKR